MMFGRPVSPAEVWFGLAVLVAVFGMWFTSWPGQETPLWRFRWWWSRYTYRCWGCGRWERVFGRPVGDHRKCPPF